MTDEQMGQQLHESFQDGYRAGNRGVPELLKALTALHASGRPARGGSRCRGCNHKWPCPTRRQVNEYYARRPITADEIGST